MYCCTEMTMTKFSVPLRLDRMLIKVGVWECPVCLRTKAIYQKSPQSDVISDGLIKSVSCFCCNDSGIVHHSLVKKFILSDYNQSDPPVPCRRCPAGLTIKHGWGIASKTECEEIHNSQLRKISFSSVNDCLTAVQNFVKSVKEVE